MGKGGKNGGGGGGKAGHTTVYTDGSCRNQGQPNAKAGTGVFFGNGHPDNRSRPLASGPQNNTRAEYKAVQHALDTARQRGYSGVTVKTDSRTLVDSVGRFPAWKANDWHKTNGKPVAHQDLLKSIDRQLEHANGRLEYVPGHRGEPGNVQAHQLAQKSAADR